jgi:hypothetical protein
MKTLKILTNKHTTKVLKDYISNILREYEHKFYNIENLWDSGDMITPQITLLDTAPLPLHTNYYGESTGKYSTNVDKDRDYVDWEVSNYGRRAGAINIGIGRGAHVLTAASGGRIIQHVTGHTKEHVITDIKNRYTMPAESSHNQMMHPFELPEDKYRILFYSRLFKSHTYLDGRNEEMDLPVDFVEPEVVEYRNTRSLAIQPVVYKMNSVNPFHGYIRKIILQKI